MNLPMPAFFAEVTRLHRAALGNFQGVLMVACTQPGEGATLLSHLLAQRSAAEGKKTLLVDLNLRHSAITEQLGLKPRAWPVEKDLMQITQEIEVLAEDGVHVLPVPQDKSTVQWLADPTNAAQFMKVLKDQYDHVVIDTTPITVTNRNNADAVVLASAADRVILVLAAGKTPKEKVRQGVQDLQNAGANVIGVAVNDLNNQPTAAVLNDMADAVSKVNRGLGTWLRFRAKGL